MIHRSVTASFQWLFVTCCVLGVVLLVAFGCQHRVATDAEHAHEHSDEHEHPETYAAALAEIKELRETVQNAFASGTVGKEADGALHELGHLLEEMGHLAEHAGLSGEDLTAVEQASDRVFKAYMKLDDVIHRDAPIPEGTYNDVADSIDSGIAELEAKLSLAGEEENHQGHEIPHDHE